jgi:hypothetical protein
MHATNAHPTCVLALVPAACLKLWLLAANIFAWLLIILAIYKLFS